MTIIGILALAAATISTSIAPAQPDLTKGVNISHWFWLPKVNTSVAMKAYFTAKDADQLRDLGITHARVPVEPEFLWDVEHHRLYKDRLAIFKEALDLLVSRRIAVIIDLHANKTVWAAPKHPAFTDEMRRLWGELATSFASTDPDFYAFEILNEPHDLTDSPELWPREQESLYKVIRAAAPNHTIIATGDEWGSIKGLERLHPSRDMLEDARVMFSFHFYEPHTFTHQGATWGAPNWKYLKKIPYPSTPERIEESLKLNDDPKAKDEIRWYAKQDWNQAKLVSEISKATAWAKEHHVRIYCGEFGAYGLTTDPKDRAAWTHDVATALSSSHIGFALWDYAGGFALASGDPGKRVPDKNIVEALKLRPVSAP